MNPQQILAIRQEWDAKTINVRAWADALKVSPETIRKVGRRDTYRNVAEGRQVTPPPQQPPEGGFAASAARIAGLVKTADGMVEELTGNPLDE